MERASLFSIQQQSHGSLLLPGALYTAQLHYPPTTRSNYKIEVIAREKECPEISN